MSLMRKKRSFALCVVDSDSFLNLPRSTRLLYYDLVMRADDRGFISSPQRLLRTIDAAEKDLENLIKAQYIHRFSSKAIVIMDWPKHNSIRRDRFIETECLDELKYLVHVPWQRYRLIPMDSDESLQGSPEQEIRTPERTLSENSLTFSATESVVLKDDDHLKSGMLVDKLASDSSQHVARLAVILQQLGLSSEDIKDLLTLPCVYNLTDSQLQYACDFVKEHASINPAAYLKSILNNSKFFSDMRSRFSET